jgi:large subunit ribosomal protein L3
VVGNRTNDKDGYIANIIGFLKPKKLNKPQQQDFIKKNIDPKKHLKEERLEVEENLLEIGSELKADFEIGDKVIVQSKSTGKGFAGVMKRHNFGGLRASHGVSISHRSAGGTGQNQNPGRVFKGKKMAGHLGAEVVTQKNLEVLKIDEDNSLLFLKGSVPGKRSTIVRVYK